MRKLEFKGTTEGMVWSPLENKTIVSATKGSMREVSP